MIYKNLSDYEDFRATLNDDRKCGNDCFLILSLALLCTFISIISSL
jgi:hypothetical protein